MAYKNIGEEKDLDTVGGFETRPVIKMDPDVKMRFVMRGLSVVERTNADGEPFDSTQLVVMMPKDFSDEEGYELEYALSLGGQAAKSAASYFVDSDRLKDTGEVWLDPKWVNMECDIKVVLLSREGDEDKGYSPIQQLKASKAPIETGRTDLPEGASPCADYQQPDKDGVDVGGTQYQM